MYRRIKLGTRPSRLALKQAEEIQARLPWLPMEIIPIQTAGDRDKFSPLLDHEESNFFTGEIEQALREGRIDAAVHSAKDLEKDIPPELLIAAVTASVSRYECLVSRNNVTLDSLPLGACVGTSSRTRQEALLRFRPDLVVKKIRGTIEERLEQLDRGDFDAVIIAHAALLRLDLAQRISQIIPKEIIPPHPMQGRLAVQIHCHRTDLLHIFRSLNA